MKPLVSVLVPVHNEEKYLGRCLRSLLAQDMARDLFEIVVVDDGSTDRTSYALELFEGDITLVTLDRNQGLPSALNAGLVQSKADFVVRVDADDYVNAQFLSILHLYLDSNEDFDSVACDYLLVNDDESVIGRRNVDMHPIACGIMFRISHLVEMGMYDENFLMHEDLELRHRFLQKYSIHRIPIPLYRYRRHELNMTNNFERLAEFRRLLEIKHETVREQH